MTRFFFALLAAALLIVGGYWTYRLMHLYIEFTDWFVGHLFHELTIEQHWIAVTGLSLFLPLVLVIYLLLAIRNDR